MKIDHLKYLRCPACSGQLELGEGSKSEAGKIKTGELHCSCGENYPIENFIPRFVSSDNYAKKFGYQWLRHAKTQFDSYTGRPLSRNRFFATTQWPERLENRIVIEAGCGAGRFTEIVVETGAMVLSFDYSVAVDANYASNGHHENLLIVQADIYHMPFPKEVSDDLFCLGVLQHTPDVEKAFKALPPFIRKGGRLAVDIYLKIPGVLPWVLRTTNTWNVVRPITARMDPDKLYAFCERHIDRMWNLAKKINHKPWGPFVLRRLLVPPYIGVYDLPDDLLKQWMKLDMFDSLGAAYIYTQTLLTAKKWFHESPLTDITVCCGHNGVNGRATKM